MAKSRSPSSRPARGVTLAQANQMVARLAKEAVATFSGREDLDRPVDADIQVTGAHPRWKLALVLDGLAVSWCTVIDFRQQVGHCCVRMGGIAGVGTHNDHRFKGYARRVMDNSLRWMRREGYDASMLFGIAAFYPKYGYAEAFPGIGYVLTVRDAERIKAGRFRIVDFDPARHLRAALGMYHANNAGRTGPVRREAKTWTPFRKGANWGTTPTAKVLVDGRGRPAGYLVYDATGEVTVLEVGFAAPAVFGSLAAAAAEAAWSLRQEKIRFSLPEDDAFMAFCRAYGLRKEIHYRRDGGAMVRLIRLPSTLQKIAPLLAKRTSGGTCSSGRLTMRTNLDDVSLRWGGGKMIVEPASLKRAGQQQDWVSLPQWALAQLVYGYCAAPTLLAAGVLKGRGKALAALDGMFPLTPHYYYTVDHF